MRADEGQLWDIGAIARWVAGEQGVAVDGGERADEVGEGGGVPPHWPWAWKLVRLGGGIGERRAARSGLTLLACAGTVGG